MRILKSILPGRLLLHRGRWKDYLVLERFHYRSARPATVAGVWIVRYCPPRSPTASVVAAAVLSYPTLACAAREEALGLCELAPRARISFLNRSVRTISRVVVHPAFRSLGLAQQLVGHILRRRPCRYIEAMALMARAHRFFDKAGMRRYEPAPIDPARPVYFLFDCRKRRRKGSRPRTRSSQPPTTPSGRGDCGARKGRVIQALSENPARTVLASEPPMRRRSSSPYFRQYCWSSLLA